MTKTLRVLSTAFVAAIAYPTATLLIVVLMTLLMTRGPLFAFSTFAMIALLFAGAHIWLAPVMRIGTSLRRRWTRFIWELWKLNEHKRAVRVAAHRVSTTVTDSTTDRTVLGGDDR